ncbi:MAG: hypothetical protein ACREP7_14965 [Lysobacter sp.]
MKVVAAMWLALMLSACDPGLVDYPSAEYVLSESADIGTKTSRASTLPLSKGESTRPSPQADASAARVPMARCAPLRAACLD